MKISEINWNGECRNKDSSIDFVIQFELNGIYHYHFFGYWNDRNREVDIRHDFKSTCPICYLSGFGYCRPQGGRKEKVINQILNHEKIRLKRLSVGIRMP